MTIIKGSGGFIGFSISVNYFKNIKAFDPKKKKNQYIGATWKKESLYIYIYIYIYFRRKKEKLMLTIKYCVHQNKLWRKKLVRIIKLLFLSKYFWNLVQSFKN